MYLLGGRFSQRIEPVGNANGFRHLQQYAMKCRILPQACSPEPHVYLSHLFTELSRASTVEHFEALSPWNFGRSKAKSLLAAEVGSIVR